MPYRGKIKQKNNKRENEGAAELRPTSQAGANALIGVMVAPRSPLPPSSEGGLILVLVWQSQGASLSC